MKPNVKTLFGASALLILLVGVPSHAQVGVGTSAPHGALDINPSVTNQMGLVLPVSDSPETKVINPQTNAETKVTGTLVYDSTKDCIRFVKDSGLWSDCLSTTPGK